MGAVLGNVRGRHCGAGQLMGRAGGGAALRRRGESSAPPKRGAAAAAAEVRPTGDTAGIYTQTANGETADVHKRQRKMKRTLNKNIQQSGFGE